MNKKIIWTVIALLIIAASTMGILYFTTDLFKSPEQLFYRHLSKSSGLLGATSYTDVLEEIQKQQEKTLEVAGEITAKITTEDESVKDIAQAIEKGKITYNMKNLGKEQQMQGDFTLNYNNKDVITLNVLTNKEQTGIKIADLYDKYISIENNNIKALYTKLGLDAENIPDKIETINNSSLSETDKTAIKHIEQTYMSIIKETIPQESYSVQRNVTTKINNQEIKTNAYQLSLTQEQVKTLWIKLLEKLKTDDVTLDFIVNNYNKMIESYTIMGMKDEDNINKEKLIKTIDEQLEELNDIKANKEESIKITVYGAQDGVAKIEIEAKEDKKEIAKCEINLLKTEEVEEIAINASSEEEKINIKVSGNKDNKIDTLIELELSGTTIAINVNQEVKNTQEVTVDAFTEENSVKLNDMEQKDIEKLSETITTNLMKILPQKAQLLGIDIGSLFQPTVL